MLEKAKDKYLNSGGKERAAESYLNNREVLRDAKNKYRSLSEEEKEVKRAYGRNRYKIMTEHERNWLREYQRNDQALKNRILIFSCSIKMNGKTLKFDDAKVNKNEFHVSKQTIAMHLVEINRTIIFIISNIVI